MQRARTRTLFPFDHPPVSWILEKSLTCTEGRYMVRGFLGNKQAEFSRASASLHTRLIQPWEKAWRSEPSANLPALKGPMKRVL
jgi:hypothetical protein